MWDVEQFNKLSHKYFKDAKSDANQQDFEIKLNLTCQAQSTPKTIGIFTKVFCISGTNLVILAWVIARTNSKWSKFWFWSKIWPWRSGSIAPQNKRDLSQGLLHLWSKFGDLSFNESQVIVQTREWLIHTHTDTQTQATTIPEGQNWAQVMKIQLLFHIHHFDISIIFWLCYVLTKAMYCLLYFLLHISSMGVTSEPKDHFLNEVVWST